MSDLVKMNDKHALRVFFFGDSICFGQGISIHKGWVTRISASLSELGEQHEREITIINVSASGNTTRQALERMPYDLQSHNPDAVIVQFGMNDCNYWETDKGNPRVSPKAFAANLEEIITRAFTFGAQRIFLHTNHPSGRDQKPMHYTTMTYQENNERYNQIIREVAGNFDSRVTLNDIEKAFDEFTGRERSKLLPLLLPEPDWLHLSEKGHDLYFGSVYPVIKEYVLEVIKK
jgi:acyl-CoA thioesterase I